MYSSKSSLRSSFSPANIPRIFLALGLHVHIILFIFSWVRTRARQRVVAITAARKRGANWTREDRVIHSPFWWCSTFFSVLLPLLAQTFYWQGVFKELFLSLHKALVNLKRTSSQERTKALQAVADRLVFNFVFWLDPKSKHKPSPLFVSTSVCYLCTAKPVNLGGYVALTHCCKGYRVYGVDLRDL